MQPAFVFSDEPLRRIARHGAFLACLFVYFFTSYVVYRTPYSVRVSDYDYARLSLIDATVHTFLSACIIYPFLYGYLPRLFNVGPTLIMVLIICGTGLAGYALTKTVIYPFRDSIGYAKMSLTMASGVVHAWTKISFAVILAIVCKLAKSWYLNQQAHQEAERAKIGTELQLLKAQLHPHFLFNTLNNLYAETLGQSDKASQMILKLSSILSYMLYESHQQLVGLDQEINCLKNYIALERIRYGDRLDLSFTISGDIGRQQISPLLLLPLVENAFKHGASETLTSTWITIDIDLTDNQLSMNVINPCVVGVAKRNLVGTENNGIGLINITKQLALLYGPSASLQTNLTDDVFTAHLQITL